MKNRMHPLVLMLLILTLGMAFPGLNAAWAQAPSHECAQKTDATEDELSASVPELANLHEVVYPLWHTAYSNKDYAMIKELLPQADTLTVKLDGAKLPGILREKQGAWDEAKTGLKSALKELHAAAEKDDQEAMLKQTEAFHSAYEKLVRTIRPMVPELESFHQEMYKLYHYYTPQYDLEKIRATVPVMQEKVQALKKAQLSKRLADRQKDFDARVVELDKTVADLAKVVKKDSKEDITKAVEVVHTAYQKTQEIFD